MKTGHEDFDDMEEQSQPEVERGLSAVAAAPAKNIFIMIVVAIIIIIALWYSFFATTEEEKKQAAKKTVEVSNKIATSKPATPDPEPRLTALPALPSPPPLVVPTPPPPPPPPAAAAPVEARPSVATALMEQTSRVQKVEMETRRKSSLMFGASGGGGGGGGASAGAGDTGEIASGDGKLKKLLGAAKNDLPDTSNSDFTPSHTSAAQQRLTKLGDIGVIIAQGKIIDAVLETAINTDIPGVLRAVISRDVYAEAGKRILIPKGSRLIGNYQADVKIGQRRVNIIWTRVILPSGFDLAIDSPATDQLGRAGIEGIVDNKFKELFSSAILVSTVSTVFAATAQNLTNSGSSTTSTSTGSSGTTTTTTADPTDIAISGAVQQIGNVGQTIAQQMINTKPTITIDQGSRIKVFVNRDLIFPSESGNVRFVQ